jgi:hypothetical protein
LCTELDGQVRYGVGSWIKEPDVGKKAPRWKFKPQ